MSKGKKRKQQPVAALQPKVRKSNPFESVFNRNKFETPGRNLKGGQKNVIQSRSHAIEKRQKTLLVEYRGLRKANAFIDRRFGEDDERLTEEERALARFQAQRVRDARRGAKKFNLTEDGDGERDEEQELTHLGKALSALEAEEEGLAQRKGASDDEEDDIAATADWAEKYHFGGGKGGASAGGGDAAGGEEGGGTHKTKKQVMEEIIQKSKQHKAEKSRQREEDEEETMALDGRFSTLMQRGALIHIMKAAGEGRGGAARLQGESEQDKKYEVMRREMAFEGRAKAGERLRTPEELEALERERLEHLERLRRKRMRTPAGEDGGGEDSEDDADGVAGPSGGYAARRRRLQQRLQREEEEQRRGEPAGLQSGDAEEDSFQLGGDDDISAAEGSQDEDGSEDSDAGQPRALSKLEARRQQQAAGDHPLQAAFRKASRRLLVMHGKGGEDGEEDEEDSEEEGEEGSEEGEEGSDEGEEAEEEEEAGSEDVGVKEGEEGEGEEAGEEEEELGRQHIGAAEDGEEQKQQQAACAEEAVKRQRVERATMSKEAGTSLAASGPLELPFTLPVPQSLKQFRALVQGRVAADLAAVIARIRAYNAPSLAADNQHKLQVFYGILVSHYASLAAQSPLPREQLDAMVPPLLELSADVPLYAGEAARARLAKMNDELSQRLKAPWEAAAIWPGARAVLLLKLFLTLFPASDRRHPVCTPATHFIGRALSQCPVSSARHAAHGLLFCGLALELAAPARRLFPEVVTFCSSLLEAAAAELLCKKSRGAAPTVGRWLGAAGPQLRSVGTVPDLQLWSVLEAGGASARPGGGGGGAQLQAAEAFRMRQVLGTVRRRERGAAERQSQASVLRAALLMQRRALALADALPSLPELVQPAVAACERLQEADAHLPEALVHEAAASRKQLQAAAARTVGERRPLVRSGAAGSAPAVKPLNPKFEEDFRAGKDYDHDRVRAEERKLKRKVAKEKRGAVRELRKDAAFMAEQRDHERAVVDAERLASERSFYSMLQQQQADARSGGQSGMNPHLKAKKKKQ